MRRIALIAALLLTSAAAAQIINQGGTSLVAGGGGAAQIINQGGTSLVTGGGGAAPNTNLLRVNSENLTTTGWVLPNPAAVTVVYGAADPFGGSPNAYRASVITNFLRADWAGVSSPTTHQVNGQYVTISWYVRCGLINGAATDFRYVGVNTSGATVVSNVRINWASSGADGAAISSLTASTTFDSTPQAFQPTVAYASIGSGWYRVSVITDQTACLMVNRPFRVNTQPWAGTIMNGNILYCTGFCINAGNVMLDYEPTSTRAGLDTEVLPYITNLSFYARNTGQSKRGTSATTWSQAGVLSMRLVREDDESIIKDLGSSGAGTSWAADATLITGLTVGKTYFIEYALALTDKLDNWGDTLWRKVPHYYDTGMLDEFEQPIYEVVFFKFVLSTSAQQFNITEITPWNN